MKRASRESIRRIDQSRHAWAVVAPSDHVLKDVLQPGYLAHRAREFVAGAQIEITSELHHFIVTLYVLSVDTDMGTVAYAPISIVDLTKIQPIVADYESYIIARQHGTVCVLSPDGRAVKTFANETTANEWLAAKKLLGMVTAGGANG